jgi:hypothetical protein
MPFHSNTPIEPQSVHSVMEQCLPVDVVLSRVENRKGALVVLIEPDSLLRVLTEAIGLACPSLPPHHEGRPFVYHVTAVRTADADTRKHAADQISRSLPLPVQGRELWRFDWQDHLLKVTWKAKLCQRHAQSGRRGWFARKLQRQ